MNWLDLPQVDWWVSTEAQENAHKEVTDEVTSQLVPSAEDWILFVKCWHKTILFMTSVWQVVWQHTEINSCQWLDGVKIEMTWPQKKLFSGSVSLQNRKKPLWCNACRKSLKFRVCLSRQLAWTLEILVGVKLDKKCWSTENYLWKLCRSTENIYSEQGLWIREQFALWKDQGLVFTVPQGLRGPF